MSGGGAYRGVRGQSAEEFRKGIGGYDPKGDFAKAIKKALALERFGRREPLIIDLMSGPGKVSKELIQPQAEAKGKKVHTWINDVDPSALEKATSDPEKRVLCDVRELARKLPTLFDIAVARYGIKDLTAADQPWTFKEIRASLLPEGRLIVADMNASRANQDAVIFVHSMKQKLAGRDAATEGICHIPTKTQWLEYALKSGFSPVWIARNSISQVNTMDWKSQFGVPDEEGLRRVMEMNKVIAEACARWPGFQKEFNVRFEEEGIVKLDFPIMVMVAENKRKF